MIVHSDSEFGFVLAVLLTLAAIVSLFASVVFAVRRKFHFAIKVAGVTFGAMAAWILVVTVVSFATPQTVVKVGDSYCADIRCIGIDKVHAEVKGPETIYDLEVRLFSDANTVKVTFGGVSPVLMDEQGRRYPMVSSSDSRLALDAYLDPGQTIKTTLAFAVPTGAQQLFLLDTPRNVREGARPSVGGKRGPVWAPYFGLWLYLAWLGNDASPLHKTTMLRVQ